MNRLAQRDEYIAKLMDGARRESRLLETEAKPGQPGRSVWARSSVFATIRMML